MARITFHGATETVTGSRYLLETDGASVLVDCGLFQGLKTLRLLNWNAPRFSPAEVDAIVLTHAHIDHVGYLPRLVKLGYHGPIYCTPATKDLLPLQLMDSAENQERDAEYANRKGFSKHRPALPLYEKHDVERTLKMIEPVHREEWFAPKEPIWMRYHDAGHLLGSSMIEVELRDRPQPLRLLFSGDVGRYDAPLYFDPTPPPACDYLICESTYGDRDHPEGNVLDRLCEVVQESIRRGGVMVVAAFAVGRAQQLIYLLQVLMHAGRIPRLPVFLDSPMAIDATNIYRKYSGQHDLSEGQLSGPQSVLDGPQVHLTRWEQDSRKINHVTGPAVIIASSGMMTGGRILHHLKRRLPHAENTILLGGFMAQGTRGRDLLEGAKTIRMHGQDVPVRAAIETISGLSGHAGRSELLRWLSPLDKPRRTFITHGELSSAQALAETLRADRGWDVVIPKLGQSFHLGE